MRIFISYASEQRSVADRIALGLRDQGHEVFFDRDALPPGDEYNRHIRDEIRRADLLVFLISPASVSPQRYTLTELKLAREHWKSPTNRVLPVMVEPTPFKELPAFLSAVSVLEPTGELTAEVLSAVDDMVRRRRSRHVRRFAAIVFGVLAVVAVALVIQHLLGPEPRVDDGPKACYLEGEVRRTGGDEPGWVLHVTAVGLTNSFKLNDAGRGPFQVTSTEDAAWQIEVADADGVLLGAVELIGCPSSEKQFRLEREVDLLVRPREVD